MENIIKKAKTAIMNSGYDPEDLENIDIVYGVIKKKSELDAAIYISEYILENSAVLNDHNEKLEDIFRNNNFNFFYNDESIALQVVDALSSYEFYLKPASIIFEKINFNEIMEKNIENDKVKFMVSAIMEEPERNNFYVETKEFIHEFIKNNASFFFEKDDINSVFNKRMKSLKIDEALDSLIVDMYVEQKIKLSDEEKIQLNDKIEKMLESRDYFLIRIAPNWLLLKEDVTAIKTQNYKNEREAIIGSITY